MHEKKFEIHSTAEENIWLCWVIWTLPLFLRLLDILIQSTGVHCDAGQSKNYLHLCKNSGAWQKHPVLESKFLLFLPVFTTSIPHCHLLSTIFSTSTEQKTQRCFYSVCVSSQRESGQVNQVLLFVCISFLHHSVPFFFLISGDSCTLVATPQQ